MCNIHLPCHRGVCRYPGKTAPWLCSAWSPLCSLTSLVGSPERAGTALHSLPAGFSLHLAS